MREARQSAVIERLDRNLKDGLSYFEATKEEKKFRKELKERMKEISTKPQMVLWFIRRWGFWILMGLCFTIGVILLIR